MNNILRSIWIHELSHISSASYRLQVSFHFNWQSQMILWFQKYSNGKKNSQTPFKFNSSFILNKKTKTIFAIVQILWMCCKRRHLAEGNSANATCRLMWVAALKISCNLEGNSWIRTAQMHEESKNTFHHWIYKSISLKYRRSTTSVSFPLDFGSIYPRVTSKTVALQTK